MSSSASLARSRRASYKSLVVQTTKPQDEAMDESDGSAPPAGKLPVHTPPPLSAPPNFNRNSSMPAVSSGSLYSPSLKKRARFFSEDLHTRARRFGTPITVLVTTNPETSRRQLEVVVHCQYFRKGTAPIVFIMELRRLLFWAVLLCACFTSAGAFRAVPRSVPPQRAMAASRATPASLGAAPALTGLDQLRDGLGREMGKAQAWMSRLHQPLVDEASAQLGKVGEELGADSFDVSALASQAMAMVAEGELSMEKMQAYFTRACMSALMHKVVGGGVTMASCLAHMPQ